ncbi:hypothetical protein ACFLZJ_01615 [Nanoarchaeota archaeon]
MVKGLKFKHVFLLLVSLAFIFISINFVSGIGDPICELNIVQQSAYCNTKDTSETPPTECDLEIYCFADAQGIECLRNAAAISDECDEPPSGTGVCDDGIVQCPNQNDFCESCDDGPTNGIACTPAYGDSCVYCNSACSDEITVPKQEWCGDGTRQFAYESCDYGSSTNTDTCVPQYNFGGAVTTTICHTNCGGTTTCSDGWCGDGVKNGGEQCDGTDGVTPPTTCSNACEPVGGTTCVPNCGTCEGPCSSNDDCLSGLYCQSGTCRTAGGTCDNNCDCINGQFCGLSGTCENIPTDPDCPADKDCGVQVCGNDPVCGLSCGTCTSPATCQSGQCVTGGPDCPDDKDCGVQVCGNDPVCDLSCGTCTSPDTCQSGQCVPPAGSCELTSAIWGDVFVQEGVEVQLIVMGTDCDGQTVSFEVWESDSTSGDDPVQTNPANVIMSSGNAVGIWTAEYQEDASGNPEYYFIAEIVAESQSITSADPELEVERNLGEFCANGYPDDPDYPSPIELCGDYQNQGDCEADQCTTIALSVPDYIDCADPGIDCACVWRWQTGTCVASFGTGNIGFCLLTEIPGTDTCDDDGFLSYEWTAEWEWAEGNIYGDEKEGDNDYVEYPLGSGNYHYDPIDPYTGLNETGKCHEGYDSIVCPAQIQLPFFNTYNLLITAVIIVLVYLIITYSNKKPAKRKVRRKKKK